MCIQTYIYIYKYIHMNQESPIGGSIYRECVCVCFPFECRGGLLHYEPHDVCFMVNT